MSLRVIEIDPADTFYSIRHRLLQGEPGRVVLALPARGAPVGVVELALLRRLADRERLDVGIVTADRDLARHARALGLPAFAGVTSAEYYRPGWWRAGRRSARLGFAPGEARTPPAVTTANRGRRFFLAVLATALLILCLFSIVAYSLPAATITLRPQALPVQAILDLTADPAATAVDGRIIPAHAVSLAQPWAISGPPTGDMAEDRRRLAAQARQGLAAAAPGLLTARLEPGVLLVPSSVRVEPVEQAFETSDGLSTLTLDSTLTGLAVREADLHPPALDGLSGALSSGYAPDPVSLTLRVEPAAGERAGDFQVIAGATGRPVVDAGALAASIAGYTTGDATRYLTEAVPLTEPPVLDVRPGWWWRWVGRLPLRTERIRIALLP